MDENAPERLERILDEAEAVVPTGYDTVHVTLPLGLAGLEHLGFLDEMRSWDKVRFEKDGRRWSLDRNDDRVAVYWGQSGELAELGVFWYLSPNPMTEEQETVYHYARVGGRSTSEAERAAYQDAPTGEAFELYCTLLEDGTDPVTARALAESLTGGTR